MLRPLLLLSLCSAVVSMCWACARIGAPRDPTTPAPRHDVIPAPASAELKSGSRFAITAATVIAFEPADERVGRIAGSLSKLLATALESAPVVRPATGPPAAGSIHLAQRVASAALGDEGYELTIDADGIRIVAYQPAGLFYGLQTLRQLLPWSIEYQAARPAHQCAVRDDCRSPPLSVARRDAGCGETLLRRGRGEALYRSDRALQTEPPARAPVRRPGVANRVEVLAQSDETRWPHRSRGGAGGYYSQEQYADLVKYAQDRFITIVPEIDMPGHTNAALASYPELNCDGKAPALYSGIDVGFSTLCVEKEVTYRFITDVVREIGALTAGPYFHVGGDEVQKLTPQQFIQFVERVQTIVDAQGKQMVGWGDIAPAKLLPTTIVQHWRPEASHVAAARGVKFIVSPASKSYLDMKYDKTTELGLNWAGRSRSAPRTTGIRRASWPRIPKRRSWASRRQSGPKRSRRWGTSSTWRSRGCRLWRKSRGRRRRRNSGRTSGTVSRLTVRGGRRLASTSTARRRCRGTDRGRTTAP